MKKRLLQALARLGSLKYQEAYVVGGTSEEYVLAEDLVEDVASLCSLAAQEQYRNQFSNDELSSLNQMAETVRRCGTPIFAGSYIPDTNTLVHKNEHWIALREAAGRCLSSFGIEVQGLSPADIDRDYTAQ